MRSTRIAPLTRRQFLRRLGIATGVTLGLGPLHDLRALAQPVRPVHVVIVGAGLAGPRYEGACFAQRTSCTLSVAGDRVTWPFEPSGEAARRGLSRCGDAN